MKKIIVLLLACAMVLSSCSNTTLNTNTTNSKEAKDNASVTKVETSGTVKDSTESMNFEDYQAEMPEFNGLSDETLIRYIEDNIYTELIKEFDSEEYYIENISGIYVSKEYLEEVAYNSKSNIFFGYTLDDLDTQFRGTRYIFSLGDDGTTVVQAFDEYDDTYERVIKDVAIGTGVILVNVTVSAVSGGVGAPAVSMIFAASAKSGSIFALSSGALSGIAAGIVSGIRTKDFDQALKAGALAGSESFKWGSISGAVLGGASKAFSLKGSTLNGLTMNQAAIIQKEKRYPLDVITQLKSMEEYELYKKVGLEAKMVNGKLGLIRGIDLKYKSTLAGKTVTNLERMKKGYAPMDPTGKSYQLHHINQEIDGTLAILTEKEHLGNSLILNTAGKPGVHSKLSESVWKKQRNEFWKSFANGLGGL